MKPASALAAAAIALGLAVPARALDPRSAPSQYVHDVWTAERGLPQNTISSLAQTSDGYLWMGTLEGLVRFDGERFTVIDKTTATALVSSHVTALVAGDDGALWVGTARSGVCVLRGTPSALTCRLETDGLPGGGYLTLARAARGGVWVGTDRGGVARFDGERFERFDTSALGEHRVRGLLEDRSGVLWIATSGGGLGRVAGGAMVVYGPADGLSSDEVHAVYEDRSGRLWIGTSSGLDRREGDRFVHLGGEGAPTSKVLALREDRDGGLWIGTEREGIHRLHGGAFKHTVVEGRGRGADDVRVLFEDREGSLWFGTSYAGLHRFRDGKFTPFTVREGLRNDQVLSVLAEKDAVWIGMYAGGLDRIRNGIATPIDAPDLTRTRVRTMQRDKEGALWLGTDGGVFRMQGDEASSVRREDAPIDSVVCSLVDRRDRLWIGTVSSGVWLRTGTTWRRVPLPGYSDRLVYALHEARDGSIWIGAEFGAARWREGREGDDVRWYTKNDGLPAANVSAFHEDASGALWMGTMDAGLVRLKDDVAKRVGARDGLYDDTVFALFEDGEGRFWMSCNKGVYRASRMELEEFLDGKRPRVTSTVFGSKDGMRSAECNGPSGFEGPDGRLWFPTVEGVVAVDPASLHKNEAVPPVVIESAKADGKLLAPLPPRIDLAPGSERLEIRYTALSFAVPERVRFRYRLEGFDPEWVEDSGRRSASYTNLDPGSYRFQVLACNDDGVWNETGASIAIVLAPAFHQTVLFRVLVAGALAGALALAYFARVRRLEARQRELADLVDRRTRELAEKNASLEERTEELDGALASLRGAQSDLVRAERMASVATLVQGIAHELNNPVGYLAANVAPLRRYCDFLVRVAGALADGRSRAPDEIEALTRLSAQKDLAFVTRDITKVMDDMAEGARRIKLIVGDLQSLTTGSQRALEEIDLARVARQSVALLGPRVPEGVRLDLEVDAVPLVSARAGQLEQVLVNLIDNAIRAVGPGGCITVGVGLHGDRIRVSVADDGCGMAEVVRARAAEPFFTTRAAGEGSGLGLAIAASIVAGHHGTFSVKSAPGEGTEVAFEIPTAARMAVAEGASAP